ncbi:type II toxin-antitoxin system RelE family toxin [Amycolatopsis taiwanensis]|uniref:Toxin RelG n=1 Tax=Amycolatopsis taiwanensis TaxID=342230 RepID=A0A9W6VHT4_9PSEU|nr:type II toxin-antitoxin system RelE/ParE family toxin [Amycolatopsis taiwanensis]GLY67732.1 toxin RelG [Amycolatopsis taiwanensis]
MSPRYTILLSTGAQRALGKMPEKIVHACVSFMDGPLANNPYRVGKPLTSSWEGHYSARRGEWRVIYTIDDHQVVVEVVAINRRADVYRSR